MSTIHVLTVLQIRPVPFRKKCQRLHKSHFSQPSPHVMPPFTSCASLNTLESSFKQFSYTINVGSHHSSTSPWMSCTSVLKELFLALGKASQTRPQRNVGQALSAVPSSMAVRSARMSRYYFGCFTLNYAFSYLFLRSQSVEVLAALSERVQASSSAFDM
jgi:hypothetical protein